MNNIEKAYLNLRFAADPPEGHELRDARRVYISNIQRFCVYDGPGIRTVVFFMGCPLRCKWCQNPENFYQRPVVMFDGEKCTGCGACIEQCRQHAIYRDDSGKIRLNKEACILCGECTLCCMQQAREICGEPMSVSEVYREVMKDEIFFRNTGGGITLSGGECTLFPAFTSALLSKMKAQGVHTAVETCGFCSQETLEIIEDKVDLFLYDLKLITSGLHKKWTGQDNEKIKRNLEHLLAKGNKVVIRIPLITGVNDGEEFGRMLRYLKQLPEIRDIHLLPFHQLGSSKYRLCGQAYEMGAWEACSEETAKEYGVKAEKEGFKVNIGGWNL